MTIERIRKLGSGYFGDVWLEKDTALDRFQATKVLRNTEYFEDRDVFTEAKAMHLAQHEHVVQVYSAEILDGRPAIRMEYLPNGSIEDKYMGAPLPVQAALEAIGDACRGLEFLHNSDWLHRDIKPANLMLDERHKVKLSDFGLASSKEAFPEAPIGYVTHIPPESISTTKCIDSVLGDIYAMGATLYRLLNGDKLFRAPFEESENVIELIEKGKIPPRNNFLPHVDDRLRRVVRKCLNVDPSSRYQSASDLRHAIERAHPKVSWSATEDEPQEGWTGSSADRASHWKAQIILTKDGQHRFQIETSKNGGKFRAVRSETKDFDSNSNAMRHATAVLDRVARNGQ